MSIRPAREIAVRVLLRREQADEYTEEILNQELAKHPTGPADRGLIHELTYGAVRQQAALDWLIDRKTQGRNQKAALQILLRLGLYQLFWLDRIPDHAAVHETVALAKNLGFGPQSGFINAVLRAYLRERESTERLLEELRTQQPALGHSHPAWLYERWEKRWGRDRAVELMEWNNRPAPLFARLNTLRMEATSLQRQWTEEGVEFEPVPTPWTPNGLLYKLGAHPTLAELHSFQSGSFYIQDPSTLLAVAQLDPKPTERILDLCAAPGGKSTYIAQLMANQGSIAAQDLFQDRLRKIEENCLRLGVTCVTATLTKDGSDQTTSFDRALLDAPCSNTGVMRRRVDLRWRIRTEELQRLQREQLSLLHRAALQVRPGGTLVYSTCSLEPEENGEVLRLFRDEHQDFRLEHERQLLPFLDGFDGAYVARLVRGPSD